MGSIEFHETYSFCHARIHQTTECKSGTVFHRCLMRSGRERSDHCWESQRIEGTIKLILDGWSSRTYSIALYRWRGTHSKESTPFIHIKKKILSMLLSGTNIHIPLFSTKIVYDFLIWIQGMVSCSTTTENCFSTTCWAGRCRREDRTYIPNLNWRWWTKGT